METTTHPTLVQLVAAGAIRVVVAVGQPGGWSLLVRYGLAERALAAQRSKQLRVFRKLDTLQAYLQQLAGLFAADRGDPLRGRCCKLHGCPETIAGRLNLSLTHPFGCSIASIKTKTVRLFDANGVDHWGLASGDLS